MPVVHESGGIAGTAPSRAMAVEKISRTVCGVFGVCERLCQRGNLVWSLWRDDAGEYSVKAFRVWYRHGTSSWIYSELNYTRSHFTSCPGLYLREANGIKPLGWEEWKKNVLSIQAKIRAERRLQLLRLKRWKIKPGTIVKLPWPKIPEGIIVSMKPLHVQAFGQTYRIKPTAIRGVIRQVE